MSEKNPFAINKRESPLLPSDLQDFISRSFVLGSGKRDNKRAVVLSDEDVE